MITTEQESTLFGGWAKVQTPLKIEIGAYRHLGTASLSISKQKPTLQIRLYINDSVRHVVNEYTLEKDEDDDGELYYQRRPEEEIEKISRKNISELLRDDFKHLAFVRYVELWSESYGMDVKNFKRAVNGTEQVVKSFAGILGSQNGKTFQKSGQKWELISIENLYPKIRKLSVEIIENIRRAVHERKRKNA